MRADVARRRALIGATLTLCAWPCAAQVLPTCSAVMTDLDFGTVALRAGAANATTGQITLTCQAAVGSVGVCIRLGAGSGGAAGALSPRYMRAGDGTPLAYELRSSVNGPTWRDVHVTAPASAFGTSSAVAVFADIVQTGVATGTGPYGTTFSGAADALIDVGVGSCAGSGTVSAIPDFSVSATVAASCEVDAAAIDFGTLGAQPTGAIAAVGSLTVRCTDATAYAIRLDDGTGAGASGPTDRRMTGPRGQIRYGIYRDPGHSQPWGDTAATEVEGTGSGGDQVYGLHGLIAPGQRLEAGSYSDSVLVTVEY